MVCRFKFDTFTYNINSNLIAMGLPAPETIFGAAGVSLSSYAAIDSALHSGGKLPAKMTALMATYWAGAVLGSAVMAANRATRCTKEDLKKAARELGLYGTWIDDTANRYPEILRLYQ